MKRHVWSTFPNRMCLKCALVCAGANFYRICGRGQVRKRRVKPQLLSNDTSAGWHPRAQKVDSSFMASPFTRTSRPRSLGS